MSLPKPLAALDRHLAEQNRKMSLSGRVKRPRGPAPIAPVPQDPTVCRWCRGRLKALSSGEPADFCQAGCASNHSAPYLRDCRVCLRPFETGQRHADLCYECDRQERAEMDEAVASTPKDLMDAPRGPDRFRDRHLRWAREDREVD